MQAAENQKPAARVIAFYLPQFHQIPENDQWWSPGFTEWTNVRKCRSLYPGHVQPKEPGELGYYDLNDAQAREKQANLAIAHGVEGFAYWHYWFGNGRRILEMPFNEIMRLGKPDLPFCLSWANETWAGLLHGVKDPNRILLEQKYPGNDDYRAHFELVIPAFRDPRYIRVDGKPLFIVYKPDQLPDARQFTSLWHELAQENGLAGIHFLCVANQSSAWTDKGFAGVIINEPRRMIDLRPKSFLDQVFLALLKRRSPDFKHKLLGQPHVYDYKELVENWRPELIDEKTYPCVVPNWDTCPRSDKHGIVFGGSTPELFRRHLRQAIETLAGRPQEKRLLFLKSWNEWAEGNYIEPDKQFGRQYLEVIAEEVSPYLKTGKRR